ncbi:MAG: bifunctional 3,4-dihydroxy-2-butanone-4-phosphate synthase/GTP cyclohydrolase II [bacterium]
MSAFCTVEEAIEEFREGNIIIVVDDEARENEGDMILAAEMVTPEKINFLAKYARGLVCLALTRDRSKELDLHPMVRDNTAKLGTAFTVSIDAIEGTTTGISAYDRAETIRKAIDHDAKATDFARPGHVFPLSAFPGGVLRRAGHTEAAVDLANLAGLHPSGVLCEVMDDDGHMARLPVLGRIASEYNLKMLTIQDLIEYRSRTEKLVTRLASTRLPTRSGEFKLHLFKNDVDDTIHVALVKGDLSGDEPALVRVHSECLTGDVFGSLRCDCGPQLETALQQIERAGRGVLLYMKQEGRGIGLENKIKAYVLQEHGRDTVQANEELGFPPDLRDYGIGAQILAKLGVKKMRLMTNNPKKIVGLKAYGLEVVERVPIEVAPNRSNVHYLSTKRDKLGHMLDGVSDALDRLNGTDRKE